MKGVRVRVFVSHAGRDTAWAEWASWQIEHAGPDLTVELDCWDWQAGDDFVARMNTALGSCDRMLALFSQAYFEPARWTEQEWTAAFRLAKEKPGFLVPVRIDDTPAPPLLRTLMAPAIHGLPVRQAHGTLLAALRPPGRPTSEPPFPGGMSSGDPAAGPRLPGVLSPVWGPVPGRNKAFTGRDGMLLRLREGLRRAGRSVVFALHGEGGVGKTQLAAEYARQFAGDYDAVWWVNAEVADRIGEQYAAFATAWGLVDPAMPIELALDALRTHCRGHDRWLVVLDNATHARDIQPWRLEGPGHVLVTSRDPYWPEIATAVPVDVFTPAESIALLRTHIPTIADSDASRLAEALGHLPLALAQAAGVIAQTRMPVSEYLGLLDDAPADVLDEGTLISYPRSLAKSVRVAVAQLATVEPAAAQLVTLCAFLAPDPIPTGWFSAADPEVLPQPLASTVGSRLAYRRLLGLLSSYGIARLTDDDRLTVHRLTQRLLRADSPSPDDVTLTISCVLAELTPGDSDDPASWPAWADLLPHLRALDLAGTDQEALAWQACEAARYLLQRGEVSASHDMIAPLHRTWRDRLGHTAMPTLWAANYLGHALESLGRPHEAIALQREQLDHHRATVGDYHPATLASAGNIVASLTRLGEHEQARALAEDIFTYHRRILGEDHPDTLGSASNLAINLAALGEHERARALAEDTLARRRRILGNDHPDTLTAAHNVAGRLAELGQHEHARALDEDTLTRRRRILGNDHPDTLNTAGNLAVRFAKLGQHERARTLDEDTLTRRRRILGDNHPDTLKTAVNLAIHFTRLDQHDQARALAEDSLTHSRRALGAEHPITGTFVQIISWLDRLGSSHP